MGRPKKEPTVEDKEKLRRVTADAPTWGINVETTWQPGKNRPLSQVAGKVSEGAHNASKSDAISEPATNFDNKLDSIKILLYVLYMEYLFVREDCFYSL